MPESTTEGYSAMPAEIEGMLRNLCAFALSEPDPQQRYAELTDQQVLFEGIVQALCRERGQALAELLVAGVPITEVAARTNLKTVQKVRKLVRIAGATDRVRAATTRKSSTRRSSTRSATTLATATGEAAARKAPAPADRAALPSHLASPATRRLLTDADRVALGLPDGRQPIRRIRP